MAYLALDSRSMFNARSTDGPLTRDIQVCFGKEATVAYVLSMYAESKDSPCGSRTLQTDALEPYR